MPAPTCSSPRCACCALPAGAGVCDRFLPLGRGASGRSLWWAGSRALLGRSTGRFPITNSLSPYWSFARTQHQRGARLASKAASAYSCTEQHCTACSACTACAHFVHSLWGFWAQLPSACNHPGHVFSHLPAPSRLTAPVCPCMSPCRRHCDRRFGRRRRQQRRRRRRRRRWRSPKGVLLPQLGVSSGPLGHCHRTGGHAKCPKRALPGLGGEGGRGLASRGM